jgi:hypothetical protein
MFDFLFDKSKPSAFTTTAVSLGVMGVSFLAGVKYQFWKSNFKFSYKKHKTDFHYATAALLGGTALCLGTFGVVTSVFMVTTGVKSFAEFSYFMQSIFSGNKVTGPPKELEEELKHIENMTLEEEMDYWLKKYYYSELSKEEKETIENELKTKNDNDKSNENNSSNGLIRLDVSGMNDKGDVSHDDNKK